MKFGLDWQESDHPRGQGGRFTSKGQRAGSAVSAWKNGTPSQNADNGNKSTISDSFRSKDFSSERQFRTEQNVRKRVDWIKEQGCPQQLAQRAQRAISGTQQDPGWCYRGNSGIRTLKTEHDAEKAKDIHEFILQMPKYEGQITRGLGMWKEDFDKIKPGATFTENGAFSSWSADQGVAKDFALNWSRGQYHVVLHLSNPSYGVPIAPLCMIGSQQQILVSNLEQRQYTVRDVQKDRFYHHVYLEQKR